MSSLPGFRIEASRSPLFQRRTASEILATWPRAFMSKTATRWALGEHL